ncbi:MAG: hypothetical protein EOP52_01680 [Sphingobacteriales bacterium]|nr:MAG: hypothetical protein EOP52_01680 [Sphingobacteriales bacterium]
MNLRALLWLSLLAMAACKKTDDTPAGASNGGENYLSCTINGKSYIFKGKPSFFNPTGVTYDQINIVSGTTPDTAKHFLVIGNDLNNLNAVVHVDLNLGRNYTVPLNQRISFSEIQRKEVYALLRSPADFKDAYYYADPTTGWININSADSIGSGTFGFTAYGLDHNGNRLPGADSVVVTNGKFDIKK